MSKRKRSSFSQLNVDQFLENLTQADLGSEVKRRRKECSDSHQDEARYSDDLQDGSDNEEMGHLEPRPLHVTSRKEAQEEKEEDESTASPRDSDEESSKVSMRTLEHWMTMVKKSHSLQSLSRLCNTLHLSLESVIEGQGSFSVGETHFNTLLVFCLRHVHSCLSHYVPPTTTLSLSSHPNWSRIKKTILKPYLSDLLLLLQTLRDPSMQDVLLRQILTFVQHYLCFPKLNKQLHKLLIEIWSTRSGHTQVLAFMALKRAVLLDQKHLLPDTIKKLYLAYVSNTKFLSLQTLHSVQFMQSCLVELLVLDGDVCYQHSFVYIRQLAVTLRTALTSSKKQAHQTIYNWQYVHCLDLWCCVLRESSTYPTLQSLVYPLVHTILGVVQLVPTVKYFPVRLHLLRSLLQLGKHTHTFIPVQAYLLEVLEKCGSVQPGSKQLGKPPNLQVMLKASKGDLLSQAYHNAVLSESFELLLLFLSLYEHSIGLPELSYPIIDKLKKIRKTATHSWFRSQLKQLYDKLEEGSGLMRRLREGGNISPANLEKIKTWEQQVPTQHNSLSQFFMTWAKLNHHGNE